MAALYVFPLPTHHERAVRITTRLLGSSHWKTREVQGADAVYVFEELESPRALLVSGKGGVLFASGAVSFEAHLEAYMNGHRTSFNQFAGCQYDRSEG